MKKGRPRKYNVDFSYFSIPNLINSYWAGYIAADGCVAETRRGIVINISKLDKNHLEKFCKHINYNGKIQHTDPKQYWFKSENRYISSGAKSRLEINGVIEWLNDLKTNFNITSKKTMTLEPPTLNETLSLAYIAGYIDGDGCICKKRLTISIVGTLNLLKWIKNLFDRLAFCKTPSTVRSTKRNVFCYTINGWRAKIVIDKILKLQLPLLNRKWNSHMAIPF